jgi:hypothetical protein
MVNLRKEVVKKKLEKGVLFGGFCSLWWISSWGLVNFGD